MAQGQILYNDLNVIGALAMRDDITWGTNSAAAIKQVILAGTGPNVGADIQTLGTGILRVPTGYEANILADSRAITNRAYTDAHIAGKNLDASVTSPGAPENNKAILWNQAGSKFTMGTVALGRVYRDGLTDDGTNVSLGGTTTVNVPNVVNAIAGTMYYQANFGSGTLPAGFKAQAVSAGVNNAGMFAGIAALDMTNTSMTVTANFGGAMAYAADYSANYTTRSLTDLGYFQSHLVAKAATALLISPTGTEDGYVVFWNNVAGKFDLKAGAYGSIPDQTLVGNNSGGTAPPSALTGAQVNLILPVFTSTLNGLVPLSGGGTTKFLRADGTWQVPAGGGGAVSSVTGTANQITASPTTGAVVLSLPSNVAFPGTWSIGTLGYADTGILASAQSSTAGYNQIVLQNTNAGSTASANWNVSNDSATATTFYGEFGINSSGFTGSSVFSQPSYVYLASGSTDLAIGTYANKSIHFVVNSGSTDALTISGTGTLTVPAFNTAGIVHNSAAGVLSSSLIVAADLSTNLAWLVGGNTLTGNAIFGDISGTGFTISFYTKNTAQLTIDNTGLATFNGRVVHTATATLPGVNVGSVSADPSTPVNADMWYQSTINSIKARINGSSTNLLWNVSNVSTNGQIAFYGNAVGFITQSSNLSYNSGTNIFSTGGATFTASAKSSAWTSVAVFTGGANTAYTAATEFIDIDFALNRSVTWVDGTTALQRFVYFRGPTVNKTTTSATFTDIYTQYTDAPTAGAGVTFTRNWAAGFNGSTNISSAVTGDGYKLTLGANIIAGMRITGDGRTIDIGGFAGGANRGNVSFVENSTNTYAKFLANGPSQSNFLFGNGAGTNGFIYGLASSLSSAWVPALRIDAGAHTVITAGLEVIDVDFQFNRNVQWLAGTVGTQRQMYIRGVTYTGQSATATFTNAYSLYVDPPVAGASASITNSWTAGFNGAVNILGVSAAATYLNFTTAGKFLLGSSSNALIYIPAAATKSFVISSTTAETIDAKFVVAGATNQAMSMLRTTGPTQTVGTSEIIMNDFQGGVNQINGNIATYRFNRFQSYTIGFSSGTPTVTKLVGVSIESPSINNAALTATTVIALDIPSINVASAGTAANSFGLSVNAQTGATNNYAAQFLGGKVLFAQSTTTAAFNVPGFTSDPSASVEGDQAYNTTSHLMKFYNGTSWVSMGSGGGGITNSASNLEIMMSDGTNAIHSNIFNTGTGAGNLTFGTGSITGDRILSVSSSTTNAGFQINVQGQGGMLFSSNNAGVIANFDLLQKNFSIGHYSADNVGVSHIYYKARGTGGSPAGVINGDNIANIIFAGCDVSAFPHGTSINAIVNGSVSANHVPIDLIFTAGDGTTNLDLLRLYSTGNLSLLTSSGSFGGGIGVTFIQGATTNPTSNPTSGFILYADASNSYHPTVKLPSGSVIDLVASIGGGAGNNPSANVSLYDPTTGLYGNVTQDNFFAEVKDLIAALAFEHVSENWPLKSQKLIDLLNDRINNIS